MTASIHIVRGPAGSGKTLQLLERCRAAAGQGSVLWLTPSMRRAEQLRGQLGGVAGLLLLTFPELSAELIAANEPDVRPLSRSQSRLIVDEVIAELHGAHHLP